MKFALFALFAFIMVIATVVGAIPATLAYGAIFVVGALLSDLDRRFAMSNVAGYLSRANADTNDDVGEWQTGVLRRNAKGMNTGSTLFALMSRLGSENADSQTYNWFEKDPTRRAFYAAAAYASTSTTALQFDNNSDTGTLDQTVCALLRNGAILENYRTGERITVVVESNNYSQPVIVSRGSLGYTSTALSAVPTTPTAILIHDVFNLVTLAKPNGANPSTSSFTQPSRYLNYCQTFNHTASVENAYVNGILRTDLDGPWDEQKLDALEQVANDIEFALFFGVAGIVGSTYTTGGIRNAIDSASLTSNALNGALTTGVALAAFTAWIQSFMTVGSDTKLAFCGPNAYAAISYFANSAVGGYRIMQGESDSIFGLNLTTIQTPFGKLDLASHPLFKNVTSFNGHMMVVDLELIKQKTFEKLFFQEYEPVNGSDTRQGQFRAKLGLKLKYPAAFGYAYDLQQINA